MAPYRESNGQLMNTQLRYERAFTRHPLPQVAPNYAGFRTDQRVEEVVRLLALPVDFPLVVRLPLGFEAAAPPRFASLFPEGAAGGHSPRAETTSRTAARIAWRDTLGVPTDLLIVRCFSGMGGW